MTFLTISRRCSSKYPTMMKEYEKEAEELWG
jgi:hypothetical protein